MTKTARNGIIAAAVVAVVGVAAAPFAIKALKKQPAQPAEDSVSVTEQTEAITYPAYEDTTEDIISETLETMNNPQQGQPAAPETQPTESWRRAIEIRAALYASKLPRIWSPLTGGTAGPLFTEFINLTGPTSTDGSTVTKTFKAGSVAVAIPAESAALIMSFFICLKNLWSLKAFRFRGLRGCVAPLAPQGILKSRPATWKCPPAQ